MNSRVSVTAEPPPPAVRIVVCPYDLERMGDCPSAVMRSTGGGGAVCAFASLAATDRGLDFVCHHPTRLAGEERRGRGVPPWVARADPDGHSG